MKLTTNSVYLSSMVLVIIASSFSTLTFNKVNGAENRCYEWASKGEKISRDVSYPVSRRMCDRQTFKVIGLENNKDTYIVGRSLDITRWEETKTFSPDWWSFQ